MFSTSRISILSAIRTSTAILVLASTSVLHSATRTWDGQTSNVLNIAGNWSDNTLPNQTGDIALWNGTQPGNLSLSWTGDWTGNTATNILVASGQTSSLTMTGTTRISLGDFLEVESGAGAVSVGVGAGSFEFVFRGTTTPTFTNNSANTVTFGSNITAWNYGGGTGRTVTFGGAGDWQIDGNYVTAANGSGLGTLIKDGIGTLTLNGSQNGRVVPETTENGNPLNTITINAGTLKFGAAAQMSSGPGTFGAYSRSITNNGTFEWASSADQTLSGVISGTGAVVQSGVGALTLTNNNTYTGNTKVTAGTLIVSGTLAGGTIVDGGILAGNGSLKAVDLESGAISPGTTDTPIGTLDAISLTLGDTNISFNFDLSASDNTSDRISLTGALNAGAGAYTFNFSGGMNDLTYTLVTFDSTDFTDVSQFFSTGVAGTFALEASSLTFTTVPEPSTALLTGGLLVALIFFRRRRSFRV